jgi:mRNA interferase HigB
VRVISKRRLREFWERYPDSQAPLTAWFKVARKADWDSLPAVRRTYASADGITLHCGIVVTVFNVGGNKHRLITRIAYEYRTVYVKMVLTHKDYDKDNWKDQLCRE